MSSFKQFITEGVLDPVKKELHPDVWPGGKLDSDVKNFIVSRFYDWLKENNIDKSKVKSINLLGSIAGFQYGDNSDFDVNVVLDLPEEDLKVLRKELPNGKKPEGFKYPVNYFVIGEWQKTWEDETNGIYNIEKDKWMKEPEQVKETPFDNYKAVEETARFFIAGITSVIAEYKADVDAYESFKKYMESNDDENETDTIKDNLKYKVQQIIDDINSLKIAKRVIKTLRDDAFNDKPLNLDSKNEPKKANDSLNNLLYKYLEKLGYFEKIEKIVDTKDDWIEAKEEAEIM
jgi:hypothetical protein